MFFLRPSVLRSTPAWTPPFLGPSICSWTAGLVPGFRHSRQGCCKLLRILVWTFISSSLGWTTRSGTAESEGGGGFFHHFKKLLDCLYEVAVPFHIPGSSARGLQWFVSYSDLSVLSKLLNLLA